MLKSARAAKLNSLVQSLTAAEKAELLEGVASAAEKPEGEKRKVRFSGLRRAAKLRKKRSLINIDETESTPQVLYPSAGAIGCSFDPELAREVYGAAAAEARRYGSLVMPAPSVGIKRMPLAGGSSGFFSEDPLLVGELAKGAVLGIEENGVRACVTDVASAGRLNKRYLSDAAVDERALREIYLEPARLAASAEPSAMAPTEGKIRGEFATQSEKLIKETLREEFGFGGAVVAAPGSVSDRVQSLKAGLDIEMSGSADCAADIVEALGNGDIEEELVDTAARRAMTLAVSFDTPKEPLDYLSGVALSRRAAADSAVLLKNSGGLLPIAMGDEFALIGTHALTAPTVSAGGVPVTPITTDSVFEELQKLGASFEFAPGYTYDGNTNDLLVAEAREIAERFGRAVIVAGVPDVESGDRENITLPEGVLKLIDQISASCWQTAVILITGCPLELPFIDRIGTVMALYYSGQSTGGAIADLITGKACPGGKLPETWPRRLSDCPVTEGYLRNRKVTEHREGIYVGYRYYLPARVQPLYSFGHGLSYTRFAYSDFSVTGDIEGGFKAAVKVQNTGDCNGSEVVQIYSAPAGSDMLELRAFKKIHLMAGETALVELPIPERAFCRYDTERHQWRRVGGAHLLFAASGSRDLRERVKLEIEGDDPESFPEYFAAEKAGKLTDAEFHELLGYVPEEPAVSPYSLDSTPQDLMHSSLGANLWEEICAYVLGEGASEEEMEELASTAADMPLRTISDLSGGLLPRNRARSIAMIANKNILAGAASLLFRRKRG